MKHRHCLICRPLLLRDLQTLGYRLHNGLSLAAEDCLSLTAGHGLSYVCRLCLSLRHCLDRALLWHRLYRALHGLALSLGHGLSRTLICGSGYIRRSGHALGHRLVSGKAGLFLPLLSLALKGSLMLYSLNDCRIS